jgi:hypothetical protein
VNAVSSASTPVVTAAPVAHHDRAWWRLEAVRTHTDWSSLLRQRIRVRAWVRAGRPRLSQWHKLERAS